MRNGFPAEMSSLHDDQRSDEHASGEEVMDQDGLFFRMNFLVMWDMSPSVGKVPLSCWSVQLDPPKLILQSDPGQ